MISYKLAKQLKDAGFPQNGNRELIPEYNWCEDPLCCDPNDYEDSVEKAENISLSELTEACGIKFHSLFHNNGEKYAEAFSEDGLKEGIIAIGKTDEEAVANLWLKLNKPIKKGTDREFDGIKGPNAPIRDW